MHKDINSKMVRPDKRKGLVQLKLSSADNIIHFVWKDRTTGTTVLDLMLFPEEATFRKVIESKARVFVLEFKTSDKKHFFCMQEPKDDKDSQFCENINKYINNPPQPGQTGANPLAGLGAAGIDLGGLDQNQLLQLFRNQGNLNLARPSRAAASSGASDSTPSTSGPSTRPAPSTAPAVAPAPPSQPAVSRQALQNLLANFTQQLPPKGPSLSDIVDADNLINSGLFDNPAVVAKLAEFLPEGPVTAENLKENIRSPQFQQAVSLFNQALRSGQMASIMMSFGLDASSIGPNATIEDFLLAIQKKAKEEKKDEKMDTSQ